MSVTANPRNRNDHPTMSSETFRLPTERQGLKVMPVLHYPEFGGPHNQVARMAAPFADVGGTLVAVAPAGPGADRMRDAGVDVIEVSLGRVRATADPRVQVKMATRLPLDLVALTGVMRREQPDVVQLSSLMNPHAAYIAKLLGIPIVWQIVDTRPPMKVRRAMMAQISRLADVVMPIGEAVRDAHPGAADFGDRCVTFAAPVDLQQFRPDGPTSLREELGIAPDARVVTVIGNINPQKGHEYFLAAAAQVYREHPDLVVVLAGHLYDGHREYFARLQNQAEQAGMMVGRDVHFLGSRSDIPNVLRASDVFALASVPNSEGMPTVILEAMACGVPVVATDVAAVREAVDDGHTGFVVPSLDVDAMANRLRLLLSNDQLRARLGLAARTRAEQSFSLKQYLDAHLRAYDLAIAHQATRRWPTRRS